MIGRIGQDLNPSSDADNEESLFSSASIISSVLKVKQQKEGLLGGKHGAKEAFENAKYVKCDCICCQHGRFVYKPKFFQTKIEESECNTCIVERCECLTCPSPRRMSKPEPGTYDNCIYRWVYSPVNGQGQKKDKSFRFKNGREWTICVREMVRIEQDYVRSVYQTDSGHDLAVVHTKRTVSCPFCLVYAL